MQISNKCDYALRALLELALQHRQSGPVKIAFIAARQGIPKRFLEVILNELRQGGFVESRRGVDGGYLLSRAPETVTIGEVVRFVDGDLAPVSCVVSNEQQASCELNFQCPFYEFWLQVRDTLNSIYDGTTLEEILQNWISRNAGMHPNFDI